MSKLSKLKAIGRFAGKAADALTEGTPFKSIGDLAGKAAAAKAEEPQTAREMAVDIVAASMGHVIGAIANEQTKPPLRDILTGITDETEAWLIAEAGR